MTFQVFDNFCPDIERVIASVHAAGFDTWRPNKGEVGSSIYEGMGFWGDHAFMLRALSLHLGGPVLPNTQYFRVTNVDTERAYIHSDRETGAHTCVVYLAEHEEESGTALFRHIPTGLYAMPSFEEMRAMGAAGEELKADMVSRDPAKWQLVDRVTGRKNRALIFPAPLFHSRYPLEGIGNTAETGRLVWVSHFYKMAGNGELF
jgi:hypothetical protein